MCGKLYWITGLSGAGKTTIGNLLYEHLKKKCPNTVIFDGDALREAFGNDLGYTRQERLQCAMRYAGLCRLLVQQGIHVICCTISMFDQVREWNRSHIENYCEIYIKAPIEILAERNQKNLYKGQKDGSSKNVVGLDLEPELPKNPDIVLINDADRTPEEMLQILLEKLAEPKSMSYEIGLTEKVSKTISESDVYLFAGISGDFNPVHINRIEAERSLFGKQIAHGILIAGLLSNVIGMKLPGPGTIYMEQNLKFKKPVYIGDTLTACAEVAEIINEQKNILRLNTWVSNQNNETVIEGYAVVKAPMKGVS